MEWLNGLRKMPFDIPIVWREPKDHSSYYYSCLKSVRGITYKSIHTAKYPDLSSADSDKNHGQPEGDNFDCVPTFEASSSPSGPRLLTQGNLNDLLRDTNLSK